MITNEFAMLLAIAGILLFLASRSSADRLLGSDRWAPPRWLLPVVRSGSGTVGVLTLALEAYGLGIAVLGVVAGVASTANGRTDFFLAVWVLVGVGILGAIDLLVLIRSRRS